MRKRDARDRGTYKRLKQLKTTKVAFQHAQDVAKYRLYDRPTKCNTSVLRRISKQVSKVRVMIRKESLDGSQSITIIPFLIDFRMACNNVDVHEGAAV